jgi:hypothetical protein
MGEKLLGFMHKLEFHKRDRRINKKIYFTFRRTGNPTKLEITSVT